MPGPNSAIRENKERILSILQNLAGEEVENIKTDLNVLTTMMDSFYTRDPQTGKYPSFTENTRITFMQIYKQMSDNCQDILKNNDNPGIKELTKYLSEDISAISQAEIGPYTNLPRLMDAAHPGEVDITGVQLGKAGANLSSRVPMTIVNENGEEIKGFFTPENNFDAFKLLERKVNEQVARFNADPNAQKMAEFMEKFRQYAIHQADIEANEHQFWGQEHVEINPDEIDYYAKFRQMLLDDKYPEDMKYYERMTDMMRIVGVENIPSIEHLKSDDKTHITGFEAAINNIGVEIKSVNTNYGIYHEELRLDFGDNIDDRNAAMSTVAGLLGVQNLIVKSKPMTVINNGVRTTGTFLPNAEGIDCNNIDVDKVSKLENIENGYQHSSGYKDLADIQVLDYICGNVDRHMGNMLYKYDEKGNFQGVHGIDNDASFGGNVIDPETGENCCPPFSIFGFVSQSMARKVLDMKPETLRTSLAGHKLHDSEINAAVARLQAMQKGIRDGMEHYRQKPPVDHNAVDVYERLLDKGHMMVIPDDAFKKINFNSNVLVDKLSYDKYLMDGKIQTVFSKLCAPVTMSNYLQRIKNGGKERQEAIDNFKKLVQPEVREIRETDAQGMKNQDDVYAQKIAELKSHDKWYIRSSEEFRDMRTALEALKVITKQYQGKELDKEGFDRMMEQMNKLSKRNEDYIQMKTEQFRTNPKKEKSDYAKERLAFARQFKDFIKQKKDELIDRIKGEVELRDDRKKDAAIIINEMNEKLKNNEMTPQLAGEAIKAANAASKICSLKSQESIDSMKLANTAVKYLKAEEGRLAQSGLQKKDINAVKDTVNKGMKALNLAKEEAAETMEVKAVMELNL